MAFKQMSNELKTKTTVKTVFFMVDPILCFDFENVSGLVKPYIFGSQDIRRFDAMK